MKILRDNLFIYIDGRCKEINMGKKEKDTRKRVMFISSVGGHLTQLLQLKKIFNDYNYVLVTEKTGVTTNMKEKYKTEYLVYGTGTHTAVPMGYIARLFRRKVIFIESFAKQNSPTMAGKMVYPIATTFVVQWESMLQFYPKAEYWGWIY